MEESRIVYLDVLFGTELMMNSLVLFLYCRISKKIYSKISCFLAVLISSLCGVLGIVFACSESWWNSLFSLLLSWEIAFLELFILQIPGWKKKRKLENWKEIFLETPAMFLSAFLMAGELFLFSPAKSPGNFLSSQESMWSAVKLGVYALFCCFFTVSGLAVIRMRNKGFQNRGLKTVWITLAGKTYTVTAIIDTGNNLYDKSNGMPIHIVEEDKLMDEKQKEQFFEKEPERITFVPYSSLGTSCGLLMVIQAEQLVILDNGKKIELKNQKLGLTSQNLSNGGKWQMLLHPDLESCKESRKESRKNHAKGHAMGH